MDRRILLTAAIGIGLCLHAGSSAAQATPDRLVGMWRIDVQGDDRPRQLQVVSIGERQGNSAPVEARWGWLGSHLGKATATVDVTDRVHLHLVTNANSEVDLELAAGESLSGSLKPPRGRPHSVTGTRIAEGAAAAAAPAAADATGADLLPGAEVKQLADGKAWVFTRKSDQQKVRWDLRADGNLYGNNLSTGGSDRGRWSMNDKGQLCVEWRGNSNNVCIGLRRQAQRLEMVEAKSPQKAFAELVVE